MLKLMLESGGENQRTKCHVLNTTHNEYLSISLNHMSSFQYVFVCFNPLIKLS